MEAHFELVHYPSGEAFFAVGVNNPLKVAGFDPALPGWFYPADDNKFVAARGVSDELTGGANLQYALTDAWTVGVELYDTVPVKNTATHNPLVNFGVARKVRDGWLVMGSVGRTLRPERAGGPRLMLQGFSEWLF